MDKFWEELHAETSWWKWDMQSVSHQKGKEIMSLFEKFVAEGNDDELAKAGAMLDKGFTAEAKAETMQQEREEVYAALLLGRTLERL